MTIRPPVKSPAVFFGVKAAFMQNVSDEALKLAEREQRVTWAEWEGLRLNSYERRLVTQNLDDDALCKLYDVCSKNTQGALTKYELAAHYNEAIEREIAPLLVVRLREYVDAKKE